MTDPNLALSKAIESMEAQRASKVATFMLTNECGNAVLTALRTSQADEGGKVTVGEVKAAIREKLNLSDEFLAEMDDDLTHAAIAAMLTCERTEHLSPGHTDPSRDAGEDDWDRELTPKEVAMVDAAWEKHKAASPRCEIPPPGWWCSRKKGHAGPCAARPEALATPPEPSVHTDTPMDGWDDIYRRLAEGEIVEAGDEVQNDDGTWKPAIAIGKAAPDPGYTSHRTYRRRNPLPPAPTDHSHPENSHDR